MERKAMTEEQILMVLSNIIITRKPDHEESSNLPYIARPREVGNASKSVIENLCP
jgi:hypothetical protein